MEAAPAEALDDDPPGGAEPDLTPAANAGGDGSDPATFPEAGGPDTHAGGSADAEWGAPPSAPADAGAETGAPCAAPADATAPADRTTDPAKALGPDQATEPQAAAAALLLSTVTEEDALDILGVLGRTYCVQILGVG